MTIIDSIRQVDLYVNYNYYKTIMINSDIYKGGAYQEYYNNYWSDGFLDDTDKFQVLEYYTAIFRFENNPRTGEIIMNYNDETTRVDKDRLYKIPSIKLSGSLSPSTIKNNLAIENRFEILDL